ncbi:hypothetical protein NC652_025957 [Populus alba x Populus x berolinensis]|nr:hypothetical protein NC652_025957 [Populus alba x Populus x berolinensis]
MSGETCWSLTWYSPTKGKEGRMVPICSCALLEKGKKGIGNSVEISLRRQVKSEKSLF